MFRINEVLIFDNSLYRILVVLPEDLIWIEMESESSFPSAVSKNEITNGIEQERVTRADDPFIELMYLSCEDKSTAQIKRDQNFELIRPLIEHPEFYDPHVRSRVILSIIATRGSTKQTLYRLARRYWQRGQTPNALLPDYKNSGAKGEKRIAKDKKLGRPRKYAPGVGALIDQFTEKLFKIAIDRYVLVDKGFSFPYAHRRFKTLFETYFPNVPEEEMPSKWQMKHFYEREYRQLLKIKKRTNTIIYNKDVRNLTSTVNANLLGPGSQFEIDATIADIYLVSDSDRRNIVGRPVIYIVVDSFSRLIVGFYIGFENPSYVAAMQALVMALTDKVEYCHSLGFDWVTEEHWPKKGIPDAILADKGELLGYQIESLEKNFNVTISNTASYRSEAKGIVERDFRTLQSSFSPFAPGVVAGTIVKKRGGRDYRLDAKLTIKDFKEIILSSILIHNISHEITNYDRDIDIPAEVDSVPLQLWNWGIQNRTGKLRDASEDALRVSLLPREKATFSELGICLFGIYFTCAQVIERGWFHRNKNNTRPTSMDAAYDPATADHIYLFPTANKSEYWLCRLHDRSREYLGSSFWDVWQLKDDRKANIASSKLRADKQQRKHEDFVQEKIKSALKISPSTSDVSNASRISAINDNKRAEKDIERSENAYRPASVEKGKPAKVISISPQVEDDFSYPDFVDELFDDEDK